MLQIEKKLVVDEHQKPVAVLLDYDTFARMERVIEDHALGALRAEVEDEPPLGIEEAEVRCRVYWLHTMLLHVRAFGDRHYVVSSERLAQQLASWRA